MPHENRSTLKTTAACLVSAVLAAWFVGSPATGQQNADAVRIEYNVVSIESNALAAKLTELGNQGWEVVTITTSEARVDGANNPPKVVTEKYDVTCRKAAKR